MYIVYVKINGITCDNCRNKIKKELLTIASVKEVKITKNIAEIKADKKIDNLQIIKIINSLGYFTQNDYISENIKMIDHNLKLKEFLIILLSIIIIVLLINKIFGFNILNIIPTINSKITYGMLFITGLLTSIHCISMCGAINLTATFNKSGKTNIKKPLLYNLGRLLSYSFLGGLVGLIGSVISINKKINGLLIIIASIIMLLMSLNTLNIIKFKIPSLIKLKNKIKTNNAFIIGIINGFMPCGPLQAMQVYALSTNSFLKGFLSMFLFCLGTIPLMLGISIIFNIVKGNTKILLNKIATVLILLLSLEMLSRGISTLGLNINSLFNNYDTFTSSTFINNYQEVKIDLSYGNYDDIIVQKDKQVKLIINVDEKYLTGCNNTLIIEEFNIEKQLEAGENIIEFTPTQIGNYSMNCWMNMIKNNIKVIDDEKYFEVNR